MKIFLLHAWIPSVSSLLNNAEVILFDNLPVERWVDREIVQALSNDLSLVKYVSYVQPNQNKIPSLVLFFLNSKIHTHSILYNFSKSC